MPTGPAATVPLVSTADAGSEQQLSSTNRSWRLATVLWSLTFLFVATVTQLFRQSGEAMWRTVWAEDGALFYADALQHPLHAVVFQPYAGYALVVPRVLAAVGVHLPPSWYSGFVAVSSALIAALLALFVYFASAPLLRSPIRQAVLCGALVWWPVLPFEITGVIANTQWVMPMACFLAVLVPVRRPIAILVRAVIVVLAPLTSPLCVLFVPVALWHVVRYVRHRSAPSTLAVPALYLAASFAQLLIWHFAQQETRPPGTSPFVEAVGKLYSTRVATEFVFGVRVTERVWPHLGYGVAALAVVGLGVLLGWRWWRASSTSRWFIVACVGSSVLLYGMSLSQRRDSVDAMVIASGAAYNFIGMRYQVFPAALLLLALLVPVDLDHGAVFDPEPALRPTFMRDLRAQRFVVAVAATWVLVAFVPSFRLTTLRSGGPDWVDQVGDAERACVVDREATELLSISPPPAWVVAVPCSDLGG